MPIRIRVCNLVRRIFKLGVVITTSILLLQQTNAEPVDLIGKVQAFTRNFEFDFVSWTFNAFWVKGIQKSLGVSNYISESNRSDIVLKYLDLEDLINQVGREISIKFSDPDVVDPESATLNLRNIRNDLNQKRNSIAPVAESIFQDQLSKSVAELSLTFGGQPIPPILYHVTETPKSLIVSPRSVIRQDANIAIEPDISLDQQSALEEKVDQSLDVSSLVVSIGGIGLYPTMVMETNSINWLAEVVSHEWVHNFLTLRPLGANYGASPDLRTINETVANLAGKEIAAKLIEEFYPEFIPPPPQPQISENEIPPDDDQPVFDFDGEMHETRVAVDLFLDDGKIDEAETYMEQRREFFWENGYQIRKLNQAYFAFHGAYADEPGGASGAAEDPIGNAVRKLRSQNPSLAAFLNQISWMWTLDQLQEAIQDTSNMY